MKQLASDVDRQTDAPPVTSHQIQGETPSETDGMSRGVGCTTTPGEEGVASAPDTTETHKRDRVGVTTHPTSETESRESTNEDTEDSAAGSDVLMDGESEESEWDGSESSSSEEESDTAGTGSLTDSVSISKDSQAVVPVSPPTETKASPLTSLSAGNGVIRSVPRSGVTKVPSISVTQEHKWQSR
eukprot:g13636.t1